MPQVQINSQSADGLGRWVNDMGAPPMRGGGGGFAPRAPGGFAPPFAQPFGVGDAFNARGAMPVPGAFPVRTADQDAFAFLQSQVAHIEQGAWRVLYADIQYPQLVPVDRSAWEWAQTILHYSTDGVGEAQPMAVRSTDIPLVATTQSQHSVRVESYWVGYDYSVGELMTAQRVPNVNLLADKAQVANRVMEELLDDIVLNGRSEYGWDSLFNTSGVPKQDAASSISGNSKLWTAKSGSEMADDINDAIDGVWTGSNTVMMADTVLLPPSAFSLASRTPFSTAGDADKTVMAWVQENNSYTAMTGQPIRIMTCRGLENAASGNTGRIVAYRRDANVLRLHCPMSFSFDDPYKADPYRWLIPGMMRCGGLEVRQPQGIRYVDGITA